LRDAHGEVEGFAKVTRDLTEQLRAEESEHRLIAEKAAREAAREGEERVARLQRITAALSQAASPDDVAAAMLRECGEAIGAAAAGVYVLTKDGKSLELLAQRDHRDEVLERYCSIPIEAPTPITDVTRERVPAFYDHFEAWAEKYPALPESTAPRDLHASRPCRSSRTATWASSA
jgi:hypothetical protein